MGFGQKGSARLCDTAELDAQQGTPPVIPWQPPSDAETERIRRAIKRHLSERNKRDHEYEEKAAERVLERLWDRQ